MLVDGPWHLLAPVHLYVSRGSICSDCAMVTLRLLWSASGRGMAFVPTMAMKSAEMMAVKRILAVFVFVCI